MYNPVFLPNQTAIPGGLPAGFMPGMAGLPPGALPPGAAGGLPPGALPPQFLGGLPPGAALPPGKGMF